MMERQPSRRVLDIYVTPGCFGCDMARQLAEEIRRREFPGVEVRLVDLSDPGTPWPESVFAVPTYLLNGQVLSLGNPSIDWLCLHLTG